MVASHDWCAYQYDRPDLGEGFAVFLRRHESPFSTMAVALRGIDEEAIYEVSLAEDFDDPPRAAMPGAGWPASLSTSTIGQGPFC